MATPPICFNLTDIARDRICLACRYHSFRLAGEVAFCSSFSLGPPFAFASS
jgi:hypothetical protein